MACKRSPVRSRYSPPEQKALHSNVWCFFVADLRKEKAFAVAREGCGKRFLGLSLFSKTVPGKTACLRYVIQRRCIKKPNRYNCCPVRPDAF